MLKTYKYRLLPTEEHEKTFTQWFGCCRMIYNLALQVKTTAWVSAQKNITAFDLMKQATELRGVTPWLAECPQQSLESAINNLDSAYKAFFKGGGFPKFKKRNNRQSISFRRDTKVEGGRIRFTKIGWVDFIQHRPFEGEIRTATVSKNPSGDYYVSILVENGKDHPKPKKIKEATAVGIDMGISTFATLSDGDSFSNPRYLQSELKRLRVEKRTLSRRYKKGVKISDQSKGYHKQRLVVAKLEEKIANKRKDFLHKTSTLIIKKYDTVCLETLNIAGMIKNPTLARHIADVSWSAFTIMLQYKAIWYGKNILRIGMFEASSKICSNCGHIFKELQLSDREWDCESCFVHHDRDANAAENIKKLGLRNQPLVDKASQ